VAVDCTYPNGRVIGIDVIPAQPPKGVSTIQGNFLSPLVQEEVKTFLRESQAGRDDQEWRSGTCLNQELVILDDVEKRSMSYVEATRGEKYLSSRNELSGNGIGDMSNRGNNDLGGRLVDVVLSDMCEPWAQTDGFWKRSLSDPYCRMMNTSGMSFRDHAGSMDLCNAALHFAFDALRTGGHFVCKFYQGSEDKTLELQLKRLFAKVHREKPKSSRLDSREAYFVALRRKGGPQFGDVFKNNK
ncbi:MAG: hypothetical protein Q9163_004910, partial [Psora crenata]